MWRRGCLYQHVNNTDVAMEVLKSFYVKERDRWHLKVAWWNVGSKHSPWRLNIEQRVRLPAASRTDWKVVPWAGSM